jgi:hypothetical protein
MLWSEPTMKRDSRIKLTVAVFTCVCLALVFGTVRQSGAQDIDDCLACHQDQNLTKKEPSGKVHSLFVDKEAFLRSTHGSYACVDCHEGVEAKKHPAGGIKDVQCAGCHEEAAKKYEASKHGQLVKAGNPNAPRCYDCHSMHAVLPAKEAASTVNAANLHKTCGACHEEQAKAALAPLVLSFVAGEEPAASLTLTTLASQIATRVKGHGKVNLGCEYSTKTCSNCHLDPVKHGPKTVKAAACFNCHGEGQQKPGVIFGKIHKANVVTNPFLSVLLALGYVAALAGLVFYFRQACCCKKAEGGEPPAEC